MKKVLGILVLTLIAVCVITPKIIAPKYHDKVKDAVAYINQASGYTAKIESTDDSWFGSKTKIALTFTMSDIDPSTSLPPITTTVTLNTHYGPLLFNDAGIFGLYSTQANVAGDKLRKALVWDDKTPLYQLNLVSGFTGKLSFTDHIPTITNKEKTLAFSGYSGSGDTSNNTFNYKGKFKNITLDGRQSAFIKDMTVNATLDTSGDLTSGGLHNSDMTLKAGEIKVASNTDIKGLSIKVNSKLDKKTQLANMKASYAVDSFTSRTIQATKLSLVAELTNLNNKVFIKMYDQLNKVPQDDSQIALQKELAILQDNLGDLLASKPEFNIVDFSGTLPEGSFKSSFTGKLADIKDPQLEDMFIPQFWQYYGIASANVLVDEPLANKVAAQFVAAQARAPINSPQVQQQAKMILGSFVQQGLIKKEKDQYRTIITLKEGQTSVNNVPLPM